MTEICRNSVEALRAQSFAVVGTALDTMVGKVARFQCVGASGLDGKLVRVVGVQKIWGWSGGAEGAGEYTFPVLGYTVEVINPEVFEYADDQGGSRWAQLYPVMAAASYDLTFEE